MEIDFRMATLDQLWTIVESDPDCPEDITKRIKILIKSRVEARISKRYRDSIIRALKRREICPDNPTGLRTNTLEGLLKTEGEGGKRKWKQLKQIRDQENELILDALRRSVRPSENL